MYFFEGIQQVGKGSGRRKQQKMTQKEGRAVKEVMSLVQILLCTFSVIHFLLILSFS